MKPKPSSKESGGIAPSTESAVAAVIAYSLTGFDHLSGEFEGNGNQDCFGRREVANGMIAVTCDGCGTTPDSATGSRAAVRIILDVCEKLLSKEPILTPEDFARELQSQLLVRIEAAARPLTSNSNLTDVLYASYLFTMLVGVVTADWTAVFGCGDGYFAVNGKTDNVPPRPENRPEYLTYLLFDPVPVGFEDVKVRVLQTLDTLDLVSLMVATDGIGPVVSKNPRDGFTIADLWKSKQYRDSMEVKALFDGLNRPSSELKFRSQGVALGQVSIENKPGIFSDDTTFVVLVRDTPVLPESWKSYRRRHDLPVSREERASRATPAITVVSGSDPQKAKEVKPPVLVAHGSFPGWEPSTVDVPVTTVARDVPSKGKTRWLTKLWRWLRKAYCDSLPPGVKDEDPPNQGQSGSLNQKKKGGSK